MASNGSFQGKIETEDSDIVSLTVEKQEYMYCTVTVPASHPRRLRCSSLPSARHLRSCQTC